MKNNILITGASSGVGKALVEHLSLKYNVIAVARRINLLKSEFSSYDNVSCYQADLSNLKETSNLCKKILKNHGRLYYIINNAGVLKQGDVESLEFKELDYSMKVNVYAPLLIIKFFLNDMKNKNFGRVINLTSGAPLNCFPNFGAYSASKAALNTMTVTLSKEINQHNIKINLMSPGPVKTEMNPDSKIDPSVCFPMVDYLLNLDKEGENGGFFWLKYEVPLFPDLKDVKWFEGIGGESLREIF